MKYIDRLSNIKASGLIILAMSLSTLISCRDDILEGYGNDGSMSEMTLRIETEVPFGDFRATRADALGNTDVQTLWVGAYDIQTGNRVGAKHFSGPSSTVELPILYYDAHPRIVVVGVANYTDAKDFSGADLSGLLDEAEKWSQFLDINVSTPMVDGHAAVDPGQSQVMMGVLVNPDSPRAFFGKTEQGGVSITNAQGFNKGLIAADQGYYGSMVHEFVNGKIYLNRLYSQVNVNVKTGDGIEVSDISYRRCNMPKATYLAERPTWTGVVKTWNTYLAGTPNYADTQMTPSNGLITNAPCYDSDGENEWTSAGTGYSFSFAHLDNKHWKGPDVNVNTLTNHDQREAFSDRENKVVRGLAHSYNNQASYFVVRMNVLDRNNGQSAQVEYTIHEGFINDELGAVSPSDVKNGDYASFRNMIYNYNITVNGINYITYNVSQSDLHHDGVSGTIWEAEINTVTNYKGKITIDANAGSEPVFRFFVGRGEDVAPLDYISGNTDGLAGMYWPNIDGNTQYTMPSELESMFIFSKDGRTMTLSEFIADAKINGGTYDVTFNPAVTQDQKNPNAYRMGIYYYNPAETSSLGGYNESDADGCSTFSGKKFHILEWTPNKIEPKKLEALQTLPTSSSKRFINRNISIDLSAAHAASSNSAYNYGTDFYYQVTIGGLTYTAGSDLKVSIPQSALMNADSYSYTVQAIAIDEEYFITSDKSTSASGAVTFGYPNWDFSHSSWTKIFQTAPFTKVDNNYWQFNNNTVTGVDKMYLYSGSTGKTIRGYVGSDKYLNLQNSGPNCDIYFTIYQNCKITISGTGGSGRSLNIKKGDADPLTVAQTGSFNYTTTLTLPDGADSMEVRIYSTGGSMSFKKIDIAKQ